MKNYIFLIELIEEIESRSMIYFEGILSLTFKFIKVSFYSCLSSPLSHTLSYIFNFALCSCTLGVTTTTNTTIRIRTKITTKERRNNVQDWQDSGKGKGKGKSSKQWFSWYVKLIRALRQKSSNFNWAAAPCRWEHWERVRRGAGLGDMQWKEEEDSGEEAPRRWSNPTKNTMEMYERDGVVERGWDGWRGCTVGVAVERGLEAAGET